jgi:hypothetical protein
VTDVRTQRSAVSEGIAFRPLLFVLCFVDGLFFALCASAEAQQPAKKIPRASSAYSQAPRLEAFEQGKRALGYVEGRNVLIEIRSGEGDT